MSFTFRPAVRENVGLLIGLAGASGSGKTYTALRLARGIAGDKPFAVIDTEAGRAKHYADAFKFDHGELKPPFRPKAYAEAIAAADAAGYPVIVVDSMSHEWVGTGGCLDWQEEEYERLGGKDSIKLLSWSKPKQGHKQMVQRLLQVRAHLILCFRAEDKIDMVKDENGKTKIVPKEGPGGFKGWLPICEKNLPYELTASFLLRAERPGVPDPIKLQEQHRPLFPAGVPITEESGRAIAAWAAGGAEPAAEPQHLVTLRAKMKAAGVDEKTILTKAEVDRMQDIDKDTAANAVRWLDRKISAATGKVRAVGAPEPITDEADALRKIEHSQDAGEASAILDLCVGQPFYDRAANAVRAQFP